MTRTMIQQARDAGNLELFFDFRGGILLDQSGNGHVLTVPSNGSLSWEGLRCTTTAATVSIDLSHVQNLGVFALLDGVKYGASSEQFICLHTLGATTAGAFIMYQTTGNFLLSSFQGSGGGTQSVVSENIVRTSSYFISAQFDRRLSYKCVKPYMRGVYAEDSDYTIDQNTNDGSGFADSTLHIMAYSYNLLTHHGTLKAFGIVDFGEEQWTATEQAQLYTEIRDRKTL